MTTELGPPDARQLWQQQPSEPQHASLNDVRERSRSLTRRVRRRNTREYLAGAMVIAVFAVQIPAAPNSLVALGCALAVAGTLFVLYHLSIHGTTRGPAEYCAADCRAFLRAELVHQRELLRSVWRWYLGPLVPSAVFLVVGQIVARPERLVRILAGASVGAAVFVAIAMLNQRAARQIDRSIAALDAGE